jgi:hypothetical protein
MPPEDGGMSSFLSFFSCNLKLLSSFSYVYVLYTHGKV